MTLLIGHRKKAGQGFTLIELLLATVLLMLLLGAMIFSYSSLQRGAALDEGVTQFEALLRYAQSQAATTGRKVQLVFEENIAEDVTLAFGRVKMMWEPEPLTQPGQWVEFPSAKDLSSRIIELVQVVTVRQFDPGQPIAPPVTGTNQAGSLAGGEKGPGGAGEESEVSDYQPPITFYPDGSSDSAEITLASMEPEDTRRISVRLLGLTGTIKRLVPVDESETTAAPEEEKKKEKGVTTKTTPAVEPIAAPVSPAPAPAE